MTPASPSEPTLMPHFARDVTGSELLPLLPFPPPGVVRWLDYPLPMERLWGAPGSLPAVVVASHMVWLARAAGVARAKLILALIDVLRLGVYDCDTRDAQLYLGALGLFELHVQDPCAVSVGDLATLVMPSKPSVTHVLRGLQAALQDRNLLALPGIDLLVLRVPYQPNPDPTAAVRRQIPWSDVAARFEAHVPTWAKRRDAR